MFQTGELESAWRGVLAQECRAEVPDVIGWADRHRAELRGCAAPALPVGAYLVPKASPGATRRVHVVDPGDHARYRSAVARVAGTIERMLGPEVAANRTLPGRVALVLEPWTRAWSRHQARLKRLLHGRRGAVMVADVRDCFGRIAPETVERSLAGLGCDPGDVAALGRLLRMLSLGGTNGLPVGPDPSGVLANAVLSFVDRALANHGARHLRWVDDFVIRTESPVAATEIQEVLRQALESVGLEVAPEKCRIVEGDGIRDLVTNGTRRRSGARPRTRRPDCSFEERWRRLDSGRAPDPVMVGDLQAVAVRRWGRAEARTLTRVADDAARSGPVRAWAWRAVAGTDPRACTERAAEVDGEPDPHVQRALAAAAGQAGGATVRLLLRDIRARVPHLGPTVFWALG